MILLGYDIMKQVTVARYLDTLIVCEDSDRAREIINELCAVAEKISPDESFSLGKDDGVEVVMIIKTPWVRAVQYSDQAWNDLLSIAVK